MHIWSSFRILFASPYHQQAFIRLTIERSSFENVGFIFWRGCHCTWLKTLIQNIKLLKSLSLTLGGLMKYASQIMVSRYNKRGMAYVGNVILHFWESPHHTLTPITSYESSTVRSGGFDVITVVSLPQIHQGTEVTNTQTVHPAWVPLGQQYTDLLLLICQMKEEIEHGLESHLLKYRLTK